MLTYLILSKAVRVYTEALGYVKAFNVILFYRYRSVGHDDVEDDVITVG
jgi:hypothetical protein